MPEIALEQEPVLDLLKSRAPALSATSDMPVVEATPEPSEPEVEAKEESTAVPPEESGEAEHTDESATSDTDEQTGHSGEKVPRGVGKRLAELTKRADEAEKALAREREERLKMYEAQARNQTQAELQAQEQVETAPEKPNRADFPDDNEWDAAMLDYSEQRAQFIARKEIRATIEREREESEKREIARAQEETRQRHQARVDAALEKYPDFHEVAETPDVRISMPMVHAILHSDMGPDLQYFLGKNPAEVERIMKLPPPSQLLEMGKIEAKLATPAPAPVPKKEVSSASPPIRPIRPTESAPARKDPGEMSMDEYKAWRRKQAEAR